MSSVVTHLAVILVSTLELLELGFLETLEPFRASGCLDFDGQTLLHLCFGLTT